MLAHARAQSDPFQQLITYDQPAQTVKQLLADLSKQTGVRLFAPNPIDDEIVLVSVKQMPLKELMDHLAYVTDGEWFQQKDGSYHLVRSPKLARERREQDNEQILKGLQRALEQKEVRRLAEPLTEQQVRASRDKIKALMREIEASDLQVPFWKTPEGEALVKEFYSLRRDERLAVRLVQKIGLRRLLEIPVGERRVFSNVRGRFLLPFGFSVEALVQQYVGEHRLLHELWTHPTEGISNFRIYDDDLRQPPPDQPLTRVYLIADRRTLSWFSFTVVLASEGGAKATRWRAGDWDLWAEFDMEDLEKSPSPETPPQTAERVEWSERTRQFLKAYRAMQRTTESMPLPEILDPAKVEPLSLIPTDVLRALAQKKGKSIVALLDDNDYVAWFNYAIGGRDELGFSINELSYSFYYSDMQEMENLLRVKPRLSSYKWDQRVSRQAMSNWLRRVLQQKYMRLEDHLALLRLSQKRPDIYRGLESLYLSLVVDIDTFFSETLPPLDSSGRRFLASLTAEQIAQLRAGKELPLSAFSAAQRELLVHDLYFGNAWLAIRTRQTHGQVTSESWEGIGEITIHQVFPDGLPLETRVGVQESGPEIEMGTFTKCKAGVWSEFRSVSMMAYVLASSQGAEIASRLDELSMEHSRKWAERYQTQPLMPARRQPFVLEVRLGEDYQVCLPHWGNGLSDYRLLNNGKPAMLSGLPKELKDELEEMLKDYLNPDEELKEILKLLFSDTDEY
jgi:hypothetical protein